MGVHDKSDDNGENLSDDVKNVNEFFITISLDATRDQCIVHYEKLFDSNGSEYFAIFTSDSNYYEFNS